MRLGRAAYAGWGVLLVIVKYNLDRALAAAFGQGPFLPWYYLMPAGGASLGSLAGVQREYLYVIALTALPFAIVGVLLTVARLRSAGWQLGLVVIFFLPVANVLFFAILCAIPPGNHPRSVEAAGFTGWLRWVLPKRRLATAAVAVIVTSFVSVLLVLVSVEAAASYGWGLFFALPFAAGFVAVTLAAVHGRCSFGSAVGLALLTPVVTGVLLLGFAIEGAICILMAAPIALVMAFVGGAVAYCVQDQVWRNRQGGPALGAMVAVLPALFVADARWNYAPLRACVTEVVVDAPPTVVWEHVIAFSRIPEPREWVFKTGIAYPIEAVIEGEGIGAVRRCRFSTGDFVEPITHWDPPRRLAFTVESMPHPMQEISPYRHVHPPHLEGFLVSERGEFLLTTDPDGRTRLRGTTWYRQHLWPQFYWTRFSDYLIHTIHRRVLDHIKFEAEG